MRSDTRTVAIDARPEDVLAFVGDGANLPRWAIGFAKAVRRCPVPVRPPGDDGGPHGAGPARRAAVRRATGPAPGSARWSGCTTSPR